jgi:hypothetical protein
MGFVQLPDNKNIENTNLETHVALSLARNNSLEERIIRAEKKINDMEEQTRAIKRILFAAAMSTLFGVIGTVFTVATGIR